jgi:hypothetical protein
MKLLWSGTDHRVKPTVHQRPDGGLIFRYYAPFHTDGRCEYTMWCEVGQYYQPYFNDFWVGREVSDDYVKIESKPYIFDKLA